MNIAKATSKKKSGAQTVRSRASASSYNGQQVRNQEENDGHRHEIIAADNWQERWDSNPQPPVLEDRYSSRLSYTPAVQTVAEADAIRRLHLPQNTATGKTDGDEGSGRWRVDKRWFPTFPTRREDFQAAVAPSVSSSPAGLELTDLETRNILYRRNHGP